MSITFFDSESNGNGNLPFPDEYLESNPKENGRIFHVREIVLVKSGKGYMAKTDHFIAWLWKNDKTTKQIVQALEYYCSQAHGYSLVIKLDKAVKGFCVFGVDQDCPTSWYALGNGYTTQEQLSSTPEQGGNPFILPVPLTPIGTPSTPILPPSPGTTTRKRRRGS